MESNYSEEHPVTVEMFLRLLQQPARYSVYDEYGNRVWEYMYGYGIKLPANETMDHMISAVPEDVLLRHVRSFRPVYPSHRLVDYVINVY